MLAALATTASAQSGNSPAKANAPQITKQAIEQLITKLDREFSSGDGKNYTSWFQPDHLGSLAILGRHIQRLAAMTGKQRTRSSQIIAGPMQYTDRTVVRVKHTIEWPKQASAGKQKANRHIEHTYMAVRLGADGDVVPTFAIEMPREMDCVAERKFRCPPCNYEIGGVDGFLCVPLRREQSLALEAASFYLIGTDVVCDINVLIPAKPKTAKSSALTLAAAFAKIEPSAKVGVATDWTPPMHKESPPLGLDCARVVVDLPQEQVDAGGTRTIFHVVQFGGLQHILLVRSTVASLRNHKAAIESLFKSYMLLEVDCEEAELAARPLRHHTGCRIEGSIYNNDRYGVELTGPKDWQAVPRIGGSAFRVHWTGPNGSQMWLLGHRVPAGMDAWTPKLADRWLNYQCKSKKLEPDAAHANSKEAKWHEGKDRSWQRTCTMTTGANKAPGAPPRRIMHVQVYEDLLVIVDGFGATLQDETSLRQALKTLVRR